MSTVPCYTAVEVGGGGEPVARQQQRRVLVQDHVARAPGVALAHLHILIFVYNSIEVLYKKILANFTFINFTSNVVFHIKEHLRP